MGGGGFCAAVRTRKILERAGFSNINIDAFDSLQQFESADGWIAFSQLGRAEFMLGAFPEDMKREFFEDEKAILAENLASLPEDQRSDALKITLATVVIN